MTIKSEDVSFVIPSKRNEIFTLNSVPDDSEVIIPRSKPLGKARNEGIEKAKKNWIVLCDDDISFSKNFLNFVFEIAKEYRIIGLEAYYPSPFVIGRFMLFPKGIWYAIGKFDERAHGDETEWCYRAVKRGYKISRIPRDSVKHYPHTKEKPKSEFGTLLYLIRRHPDFIIYILKLMGTKMQKSSYDEEYYEDSTSMS